jgi:branched-chain amino acid transport system ATP-binding protein
MEGVRLNDVPAHQVIGRGIAHVPENRRLFPRLTVEENLRMGAFQSAFRSRFGERLKFVYSLFPRLRERREQVAGTLSGGEQQMCAIGRGIMSRPKLLMIDELSLGLAPKAVEQLSAALVRIQRARELAILLVEQDVLAALELSSRAFVIDRGRVALSGRADIVSKDPKVREAYLGEL